MSSNIPNRCESENYKNRKNIRQDLHANSIFFKNEKESIRVSIISNAFLYKINILEKYSISVIEYIAISISNLYFDQIKIHRYKIKYSKRSWTSISTKRPSHKSAIHKSDSISKTRKIACRTSAILRVKLQFIKKS